MTNRVKEWITKWIDNSQQIMETVGRGSAFEGKRKGKKIEGNAVSLKVLIHE